VKRDVSSAVRRSKQSKSDRTTKTRLTKAQQTTQTTTTFDEMGIECNGSAMVTADGNNDGDGDSDDDNMVGGGAVVGHSF